MSNIQQSSEHPAEGGRPKKKLKGRSHVWDHFEKSSDGQVAKCKYCTKNLSGNSKGGTSHLTRHFNRYHNGGVNQPVPLGSRDEVRNIGLTRKQTCPDEVVKEAIRDQVPLASSEFQDGWYSHCQIKPVVVEKEIRSYYESEKRKLAIKLKNLTSSVSLTIEIMEEINCVSLTANFINADFDLVRKLISFKKFPDRSSDSIINVLVSCLNEWKLEEKIFRLSGNEFSSVCLNVIEGLKKKFSPNMSSGAHHSAISSCKELPCSLFLGSQGFYPWEHSNKKFLEILTTVPSDLDKFNQFANHMGLSPKNESWFIEHAGVRWGKRNLGLEESQFKDLLNYRQVFSQYYPHTANSYSSHWQKLELMLDIHLFADCVINKLSSSKHPTSNLYLRYILDIADMMSFQSEDGKCQLLGCHQYLDHVFLGPGKCAEDIFFVAVVLDPRYKLSFFEYAMQKLHENLWENLISGYMETLNALFSAYAKKITDHVSPSPDGTIHMNTHLRRTTISNRFTQYKKEKSELDRYLSLEEDFDKEDENFDVLGWWKQKQSRFPSLSRMARDILAVPVCSCSAKGTIKSGLDAHQVDPQLLEAVICSKDWIL
ncbi:Zinc finger BED domain-containing protein RICESLEEPER 4 [Rhynchospora pubera]|uniref:Zinc finger BED domain-containing protein RICESLEEPER 4 n=1 Tax=Rhynchospora pubera TaxID=906938 RepID=A0AAV8CGQ3_9POAL|nr:Zinc finger BED domain-containing protein RICESLEEPER 4 [Rhynchospora pubera]